MALRSGCHSAPGRRASVEDKPKAMLGLVNEVDVVSSSWYTDRSLCRESLRQCLQPDRCGAITPSSATKCVCIYKFKHCQTDLHHYSYFDGIRTCPDI